MADVSQDHNKTDIVNERTWHEAQPKTLTKSQGLSTRMIFGDPVDLNLLIIIPPKWIYAWSIFGYRTIMFCKQSLYIRIDITAMTHICQDLSFVDSVEVLFEYFVTEVHSLKMVVKLVVMLAH